MNNTPTKSCGLRKCVQTTANWLDPSLTSRNSLTEMGCTPGNNNCNKFCFNPSVRTSSDYCFVSGTCDFDLGNDLEEDCCLKPSGFKCGLGLHGSLTLKNRCMSDTCLDKLKTLKDLDPTSSSECNRIAGAKYASALKESKCSNEDIKSYCSDVAAGSKQCEAQNTVYNSDDNYGSWRRPYGTTSEGPLFDFGANCPTGSRGTVILNTYGSPLYALCMPVSSSSGTCPAAPKGTTAVKLFKTGSEDMCALTCESDDVCPGGQKCKHVDGVGSKICVGTIYERNPFFSNPTVKHLLTKSNCHNSSNCEECVGLSAPGVVSEQAVKFCKSAGFRTVLLKNCNCQKGCVDPSGKTRTKVKSCATTSSASCGTSYSDDGDSKNGNFKCVLAANGKCAMEGGDGGRLSYPCCGTRPCSNV